MSHSIRCSDCPLRGLPLFKAARPAEQALVQSLRGAQIQRPAGSVLIAEGQTDAPLYTLFAGWAFRYKTLSDGRRQILNILLPGDFVGLQQNVAEGAVHGVETLTEVWLCPFGRDALWVLHREAPELGYDITWLAAHEESVVDDHLLSVGRRSAEERLATLLLQLYKRAAALLPSTPPEGLPFPLTQQHIADALGLSLVHTHRTLRKLERRGLHTLEDGHLVIRNPKALAQLADLWGDGRPAERPLI
ncbi:MAG: Crp/Fnr family transcriptional regulator [Chitinophagaceae bacterium]|nr:Crp/Fnr family transcriptional regulator [Rubrivivax sp.]